MSSKPLSTWVDAPAAARFLRYYGWGHAVEADSRGVSLRTSEGKIPITGMSRSALLEIAGRVDRDDSYQGYLCADKRVFRRNAELSFARYHNHHHFEYNRSAAKLRFSFRDVAGLFGSMLPGSALDRWTRKRPLSIPTERVSESEAEFFARPHPGMELSIPEIEAYFRRESDVLIPIHPAHATSRGASNRPGPELSLHGDASVRTFQAPEAKLKLKLHLPLHHFTVARPISAETGKHSVMMSEQLAHAVQSDAKLAEVLGFLPEPVTLVDRRDGSASVVRMDEAFPAAATPSLNVYAYALESPDVREPIDHSPLIHRLILNRSDRRVTPLNFYLETFERPVVTAFWRAALLHGVLHNMAHIQNTMFEIDHNGRASGRVIWTDLEEVCEAHQLIRALGKIPGPSSRAPSLGRGRTRRTAASIAEELEAMSYAFVTQTARVLSSNRAGLRFFPLICGRTLERQAIRMQAEVLQDVLRDLGPLDGQDGQDELIIPTFPGGTLTFRYGSAGWKLG